VRENPPLDSRDLAIERRYHLLDEVGVERSAETIVYLLPKVWHPKGAERYFLLDGCRAHSVRPNVAAQ